MGDENVDETGILGLYVHTDVALGKDHDSDVCRKVVVVGMAYVRVSEETGSIENNRVSRGITDVRNRIHVTRPVAKNRQVPIKGSAVSKITIIHNFVGTERGKEVIIHVLPYDVVPEVRTVLLTDIR